MFPLELKSRGPLVDDSHLQELYNFVDLEDDHNESEESTGSDESRDLER
jgi:hypothetical protein